MATPNLSDLSTWTNRNIGGIGPEEINTPRAQAILAALNAYGANAQFVPSYANESGLLQGYSLYFDGSKLPGVNGTGHYGGSSYNSDGTPVGGGAPMTSWSTVQDHMHLANPNAVYDSPTYGKITDNGNIVQDGSWVDKYGPLIISALGMGAPLLFGAAGLGMGAAGAAQSAIGAANGGLAASSGGVAGLAGTPASWIVNAAKGLPNTAGSLANHNFNPVSLIPLATGAMGLPSWAGTAATTIGNLAQGKTPSVNPLSAGMLALQLFGGGGRG